MISYAEALSAVFLEGYVSYTVIALNLTHLSISWIFMLLSLLGLRQWLARLMPQSLVLAVGSGIGLFIA